MDVKEFFKDLLKVIAFAAIPVAVCSFLAGWVICAAMGVAYW